LRGSGAASMRAAFAATLARPAWWVMALAAFLVRGGLVIVLLPLVSLPSAASVATALAPPIEALVLGRHSLEGVLLGTLATAVAFGVLGAAGLAGAWLDLELQRGAAEDDELRVGSRPAAASAWLAFAVRLAAHLPTVLALGYATVRIAVATYEDLLSPGDPAVPVPFRVVARVPEAIVLVVVTWLVGEALGGLAVRRTAAGQAVIPAFGGALRDLLQRRGLATFLTTNGILLIVIGLLVAVVGRASDHLRGYLLDRVDATYVTAALLLLVAAWALGLAALGAALAWRATAWTLVAGQPSSARESAAASLIEQEPSG
jgi:hypothetical protein